MKNYIFYFLSILLFSVKQSYSQGILIKEQDAVTVTDSLPDESAILEITSENKGLLIPRLVLTGLYDTVTIKSPAKSLLVFNKDDDYISEGFYYWDSLKWQYLGVLGNTWNTVGNDSIIVAGTYFLGTTDNNSLIFKTNNDEKMIITYDGKIGIGTSNPSQQLSITKSFSIPNTTNSTTGIIYKDTLPYIHNYRNVNCTSGFNHFIGKGSGNFSMTSSTYSILGIGINTDKSVTSTNSITTIGDYSFQNNTSGMRSAGLGFKSLYTNSTGSYLTAFGYQALLSNTNAGYNTAFGNDALRNNSTGTWNFAMGDSALSCNTTGHYNTAVGALAYTNPTATTYSNSTAIGYNSKITASNQVRFGNTAVEHIGGNSAWSNLSDGRFKDSISEDVPGLNFVLLLRPITFNFKINELASFLKEDAYNESLNEAYIPPAEILAARNQKASKKCTGFIAQEVEQSATSVGYSFSGIITPKNSNDLYKLNYADFVVPLVKAVQEQQKMIEDLNDEIIYLKNQKDEYLNTLKSIKN